MGLLQGKCKAEVVQSGRRGQPRSMGLKGLNVLPKAPSAPCLPLWVGKSPSWGPILADRLSSSSKAEVSGRLHGRNMKASDRNSLSAEVIEDRMLQLTFTSSDVQAAQISVTTQVTAQLLRPPMFDPRKLTTTYLPGASITEPLPPAPRRYTLTHNDITGQLSLSIGCNYNMVQVSGWYTRLIR